MSTEDLRPLRILLVDDHEDSRFLIHAYLNKTQYLIVEAHNGQLALDHFKVEKYDLILMDTQMPVLDGNAATRAIRAWEKANQRIQTPIVALTANESLEEIQKTLDAGCTSHLSKPVKKAELLRCILQNVPE
jgi:CheY-like chemotaxis protein